MLPGTSKTTYLHQVFTDLPEHKPIFGQVFCPRPFQSILGRAWPMGSGKTEGSFSQEKQSPKQKRSDIPANTSVFCSFFSSLHTKARKQGLLPSYWNHREEPQGEPRDDPYLPPNLHCWMIWIPPSCCWGKTNWTFPNHCTEGSRMKAAHN